jgi:hypothetical protein
VNTETEHSLFWEWLLIFSATKGVQDKLHDEIKLSSTNPIAQILLTYLGVLCIDGPSMCYLVNIPQRTSQVWYDVAHGKTLICSWYWRQIFVRNCVINGDVAEARFDQQLYGVFPFWSGRKKPSETKKRDSSSHVVGDTHSLTALMNLLFLVSMSFLTAAGDMVEVEA